MHTIRLRRKNKGHPMPIQNPFKVYTSKPYYLGKNIHEIRTGLMMELSDDVILDCSLLLNDIIPIKATLDNSELIVIIYNDTFVYKSSPSIEKDQAFAWVSIRKAVLEPIRFIEFDEKGQRMRYGDAKEIESSS